MKNLTETMFNTMYKKTAQCIGLFDTTGAAKSYEETVDFINLSKAE